MQQCSLTNIETPIIKIRPSDYLYNFYLITHCDIYFFAGKCSATWFRYLGTLRLEQNNRNFANDNFKCNLSKIIPANGGFPAQRASNEENISIWWRHHGIKSTQGHQWCPLLIDTCDPSTSVLGSSSHYASIISAHLIGFLSKLIIIRTYFNRLHYIHKLYTIIITLYT